jgi:hypothetical protein
MNKCQIFGAIVVRSAAFTSSEEALPLQGRRYPNEFGYFSLPQGRVSLTDEYVTERAIENKFKAFAPTEHHPKERFTFTSSERPYLAKAGSL